MTRDSRAKVIRRIITLHILDYTQIPFSRHDEEWMGEAIEEKLKEKFDIEVDTIMVDLAPLEE